jgi:hypothetical protein
VIPQSNFLILAVIDPSRKQALRDLFAEMTSKPGLADPHNSRIPFASLPKLHVARFTIIEAHTAEDIRRYGVEPATWQPALAFQGDCDGDAQDLLQEMIAIAETGLREIFSYCLEYEADRPLLQWMLKHSHKSSADYVNWIGRSVQQVHEEAALQRSLSNKLQELIAKQSEALNIRDIRQQLLTHVELELDSGALTLTPPPPTPLDWKLRNVLHKFGIPLILLLFSPLLLISTPLLLLLLRRHERSDPEIDTRPTREHIRSLSVQEDHDVSNHFNVFGDVKPGPFRLLLLKFLLMLLDYSSRHIYKRGYLTRIRTIHFAHWVLLDNNRRILFMSNYDGSHESYMDDFINKVAWGLNLVFSNGVAYPTTRWLVKGGAEREHIYKYTLRRHQLPSEVWYKAYPGLTAYDLSRNSKIRAGVEQYPKNDETLREWLHLL